MIAAISVGCIVLSIAQLFALAMTMRSASREQRKLLTIIRQMNEEAIFIYHCAAGRCSKCWGSAKFAHDLALNAFENRKLTVNGEPRQRSAH